MSLPLELRENIYEFALRNSAPGKIGLTLCRDIKFKIGSPRHYLSQGLFAVNRQVRTEAVQVLLRKGTFYIQDVMCGKMKMLGLEKLKRWVQAGKTGLTFEGEVRALYVGIKMTAETRTEFTEFMKSCPKLRRLHIVLELYEQPVRHYDQDILFGWTKVSLDERQLQLKQILQRNLQELRTVRGLEYVNVVLTDFKKNPFIISKKNNLMNEVTERMREAMYLPKEENPVDLIEDEAASGSQAKTEETWDRTQSMGSRAGGV